MFDEAQNYEFYLESKVLPDIEFKLNNFDINHIDKYLKEYGQILLEKISKIVEDIENVHKAIRFCYNDDELSKL